MMQQQTDVQDQTPIYCVMYHDTAFWEREGLNYVVRCGRAFSDAAQGLKVQSASERYVTGCGLTGTLIMHWSIQCESSPPLFHLPPLPPLLQQWHTGLQTGCSTSPHPSAALCYRVVSPSPWRLFLFSSLVGVRLTSPRPVCDPPTPSLPAGRFHNSPVLL